ncbi:MAG: hypothetical protein PF518_08610, partial [Spirochaetaceae bacterium]|nr:hypothetical protein [Spirochaetaceae bacterium]
PDLLLMDEPFSALDSPTRRSLQNLILDLNSEKQYSRILVTHNIEEALILGEKILILRGLSKEDIILENPSYRKKGYRDSSAFEVLFQKIQSILGEDFG